MSTPAANPDEKTLRPPPQHCRAPAEFRHYILLWFGPGQVRTAFTFLHARWPDAVTSTGTLIVSIDDPVTIPLSGPVAYGGRDFWVHNQDRQGLLYLYAKDPEDLRWICSEFKA